jgi:ribonuclease HI
MLRKKPNRQRSDTVNKRPGDTELTALFLEVLSKTLDLDKTIKKLNITRETARSMLTALAGSMVEARPSSGSFASGPSDMKGPVDIYVDGASRGNPGEAGAGAAIKAKDGSVLKRLKKYLGTVTNNVAEYSALVMALGAARSLGVKEVRIFADSELVVKQIKGEYRVKSEDLKPLYMEAMAIIRGFNRFEIRHIPREKNADADKLANEAIDTRRK